MSALASTSASSSALHGCVKSKILDSILLPASQKSPGWLIMLVDDRSMRIVNAAVGMYDIMERRVTTVEQISRKRQPLPELDAVYFVSATDATIDQIIADYSNAKKPTYNK